MNRQRWIGGTAAALVAFLTPLAAQAQIQVYRFNLPAQDLGGALRAFGQASRQQIIFSEDAVRGKRSPAVTGSLTVDQGLQRLLTGSGLTIKRTAAGVISVGGEPPRGNPEITTAAVPIAGDVSELTVTGSRIRRATMATASPAKMVTADDLIERGFTQVGEMLNQVTSNVPSQPIAPFSGFPAGSGQTFPNLFNLGAGRTLTLLNGRRMVTSTSGLGDRVVDVNVIPSGLIQRVDIVEAGGAAVYGSDAIGGVVNYVLKDHFEGLELDAQYGESSRGDDHRPAFRVTYGRNFAEGRGNIAVDFEYSRTDALLESDRPFFSSAARTVPNPANLTTSDGQPPSVYVLGGRTWRYNGNGVIFSTNSTSAGALLRDGAGPLQFAADGATVIPYDPGAIQPGTSSAIGGQGYDPRRLSSLASGVERYAGAVIAHYAVTDRVKASGEFLYSRLEGDDPLGTQSVVKFVGGNGPSGQGPISFNRTNPFLTAADIATLSAASPTFAAGGDLLLSKFLDILPSRARTSSTDTWRALVGLDGDFQAADRDFYWSLSFSRGETESKARVWEAWTQRLTNSINAVRNPAGAVVCAINADAITANDDPNCVPLNVFAQGASDQAKAYFAVQSGQDVHNTQDDLLATLGGDLVALPAGKVKFSLAYEHRRESTSFTPTQADQLGLTFGGNVSVPSRGSYNTDEVSGELLVPVIGGDFTLPFVKALDLNGSYRIVDHSIAGRETVWGAGARWDTGYGVALRASRSRNFRAPTLDQQFAPTTVNSGNPANDPCDRTLINGGPSPAVRLANCQKLFDANPGYGPLASFLDPAINTGIVAITTGGNPDLNNEISNTVTFGLVFQPDYIPGLSIGVDRIQVNLRDGLSDFAPNNFLATCYDSIVQPADICGTFTRNAQGFLQTARATTFNAGSVKFRGEVYNFNYRFPVGRFFGAADYGDLELAVEATHTERLETSVTGFDLTRTEGTSMTPDWRTRFDARYARGPLRLFYSLYVLPEVKSSYFATIETTPVPVIKANYTHTISAQYDWDRYTFRAGVTNLTDQHPSFPIRSYGDIYGRRFFVGVRARF